MFYFYDGARFWTLPPDAEWNYPGNKLYEEDMNGYLYLLPKIHKPKDKLPSFRMPRRPPYCRLLCQGKQTGVWLCRPLFQTTYYQTWQLIYKTHATSYTVIALYSCRNTTPAPATAAGGNTWNSWSLPRYTDEFVQRKAYKFVSNLNYVYIYNN